MMQSFLIGLLILITSCSLFGQEWSTASNTLLKFSVQSSTEIVDRLDRYEPTTEREKSLYNRYKDTLNIRLTRAALESFYSVLTTTDIELYPKDTLAEYLTYGNDGLPSVLLPRRAIKKLTNAAYTSDFYFIIKVNVGVKGMMPGLTDRVNPKVKCEINVLDANGEKIRAVEVETLATDFIKSSNFPRLTFDKLGLDYIEMLQHRLEPLVLQALQEAVEKLE